jgi:hypothetical protein
VSDSQDPDRIDRSEIYDVIGKAFHGRTSRRVVGRYRRHWRAGSREPGDTIEGGCDFIKEALAETRELLFIPEGRVF